MRRNLIGWKMVLVFVLILIIYFLFIQTPERQIKKTVTAYWTCIENNEFNKSVELFNEGHVYSGALHMYFYGLRKDYARLNAEKKFKENIKIKDTIYVGQKMKYVQYFIKDKQGVKKPLILTFIFWKENGYDTIFNKSFTENWLEWYYNYNKWE